MTTVSNFLATVRYDLRDFGAQDFDDTQLLMYLNRAVTVLDNELFRLRSDFTVNSTSVTLSSAAYSMTLPTNASTVRRIYYGITEKYEMDYDTLFKRRILWNSATGEPTYWAQKAATIEWDQIADQDYAFTVTYDKWTGTLASTDAMPYSDVFNNYLVQGTTMQATGSKKDQVIQTDQQLHSLFRQQLQREVIVRNFRKRPYQMDF